MAENNPLEGVSLADLQALIAEMRTKQQAVYAEHALPLVEQLLADNPPKPAKSGTGWFGSVNSIVVHVPVRDEDGEPTDVTTEYVVQVNIKDVAESTRRRAGLQQAEQAVTENASA